MTGVAVRGPADLVGISAFMRFRYAGRTVIVWHYTMPSTYVLVDFENVQPEDLAPLEGGAFRLYLFLGRQQPSRLPRKLAIGMQRLGDAAAYVEIDGDGRNALDFHIAYYLGKFAAMDPAARFHVISRDKGYDVLIEHLVREGVSCTRHESLDALQPALPSSALQRATPAERLDPIVEQLKRMPKNRPATLKKLGNFLGTALGPTGTPGEVEKLIVALQSQGLLSVEKGRVRYELGPETDTGA